jgi:hypothetical protein
MTVEIIKTELVANWPNGRPFKHGAMILSISPHLSSHRELCAGIEQFMSSQAGQTRGTDYHIPGWNFYRHHTPYTQVRMDKITITFANDETFVMTKMQWDYG